jgi:hypothetical protein
MFGDVRSGMKGKPDKPRKCGRTALDKLKTGTPLVQDQQLFGRRLID